MIDLFNKKILEDRFADDFASPFYPLLADIYLLEGDLARARKVCEVGLDHDPNNTDGKFVLAKVAMTEEKYTMAEKWLKRVVIENPAHFNALRTLIKLEIQLNRSPNTIKIYIDHLKHYLPNDKECMDWLNTLSLDSKKDTNPNYESKNESDVGSNTMQSIYNTAKQDAEDSYEVIESMATFTMVRVLKTQRHYNQALAVLDVLESRGMESDRISKEKEEINQLISTSQ